MLNALRRWLHPRPMKMAWLRCSSPSDILVIEHGNYSSTESLQAIIGSNDCGHNHLVALTDHLGNIHFSGKRTEIEDNRVSGGRIVPCATMCGESA